MDIKHVATLSIMLFLVTGPQVSFATDEKGSMDHMKHHNMQHSMNDGRISLGLSPQMKQHQLTNMRAHLEAVQNIIGLITEQAFDKASEMAHSQLGLTEEMLNMCNMFDNAGFRELGLAFHKSGDALGDALKTKDVNKSLRALQTTLGYCVQCHAAFRQ